MDETISASLKDDSLRFFFLCKKYKEFYKMFSRKTEQK